MNEILHVNLEGKQASVLVAEIPHKHHSMFKVILECGYTNIFYTDVETGEWVEEDLGFTDMARQIGMEISKLQFKPMHVPKFLTWHAHVTNGKPASFGFFSFLDGPLKMFEIYNSSRKYMYTLVEIHHDEWQILDNNNVCLERLDNAFIQQVIKVLPLYADFE